MPETTNECDWKYTESKLCTPHGKFNITVWREYGGRRLWKWGKPLLSSTLSPSADHIMTVQEELSIFSVRGSQLFMNCESPTDSQFVSQSSFSFFNYFLMYDMYRSGLLYAFYKCFLVHLMTNMGSSILSTET